MQFMWWSRASIIYNPINNKSPQPLYVTPYLVRRIPTRGLWNLNRATFFHCLFFMHLILYIVTKIWREYDYNQMAHYVVNLWLIMKKTLCNKCWRKCLFTDDQRPTLIMDVTTNVTDGHYIYELCCCSIETYSYRRRTWMEVLVSSLFVDWGPL